jgi:diacylglycerol kinase family enzyme
MHFSSVSPTATSLATILPLRRRQSLQDGLLDIVVVQKMNKAKLPFAILQQVRGNNKLQQLVAMI